MDNDWFLCPMKIAHHQGELITSSFPVENRLLGQVGLCWTGSRLYLTELGTLELAFRSAAGCAVVWQGA